MLTRYQRKVVTWR